MDKTIRYFDNSIIKLIFQYLSINDIELFIESSSKDTKDNKYITTLSVCFYELGYRVNPHIYLSKYYNDSEYLLDSMFNCGCVITGSRALEVFMPGSVSQNSDWNFFITGGQVNVIYMIQVLEKLGTIWETKEEKLSRINKTFPLNQVELAYISRNGNNQIIITDNLEYLEIKQNKELNSPYSFSTIKGTIKQKSSTVKILLTFDSLSSTPLQMIKSMQNTAGQCFISKAGIGHLYYKDTCNYKNILLLETFDTSYKRSSLNDDIRQYLEISDLDILYNKTNIDSSDTTDKYTDKGYTTYLFRNDNTSYKRRYLCDNEGKFISLADETMQDNISIMISSTSWYEFKFFNRHHSGPYEENSISTICKNEELNNFYDDGRVNNKIKTLVDKYTNISKINKLPIIVESSIFI